MRAWTITLSLVVLLLALTGPADAAKRYALVIGNSAYQHAPVLPNPQNDARAMSEALESVGFEVLVGIDLTKAGMVDIVRRFSRVLDETEVALFFYAGHGLQVYGENFLVPVDAELKQENDLDFETMSMRLVLRQLGRRDRRTNLIFLDACRDNPLARNLARSMGQARSISVGRGLSTTESGLGTLIAYATQPGNVAVDGAGGNSPFTAALAKWLREPGLEVRQVMSRVRQTVMTETDFKQVPWDHSSLIGDFYFKAKQEPAWVNPQLVDPEERRAWDQSKDSDRPEELEAFASKHPESPNAALAQRRAAVLRREAQLAEKENELKLAQEQWAARNVGKDSNPEEVSIDGLWRGKAVVEAQEGMTFCKGTFALTTQIGGGRIKGDMRRDSHVITLEGAIDEKGQFRRVWGSYRPRDLSIKFSGKVSGQEIRGTWKGDVAGATQNSGMCRGQFSLSRQDN